MSSAAHATPREDAVREFATLREVATHEPAAMREQTTHEPAPRNVARSTPR
jgi:hypothetical protein